MTSQFRAAAESGGALPTPQGPYSTKPRPTDMGALKGGKAA